MAFYEGDASSTQADARLAGRSRSDVGSLELTKLLSRKAFEGQSLYTDCEVRAFVREIAGGRPVENNEVPSA